MIAAALCLALAVLVAPVHDARRRLRPRRARMILVGQFSARTWVPALSVVVGVLLGWTVGCALAVLATTLVVRHSRSAGRVAERSASTTLCSALDTVVAELRVGAHPAVACRVAAQEHRGEVGSVFASAAARAELGGAMSDAVGALGSGADFARVAAVWRVAEVHGLRLASLLDAVRTDLKDRARSARRIEASMAGPRATAAVLAALPAVGTLLGQAMGASPVAVLAGGGVGGIMLVVGVTLACLGLLWTDAIVAKVAS